MKVEARGTSTSAKAGFGLFTVRAQSQAITVSFWPTRLTWDFTWTIQGGADSLFTDDLLQHIPADARPTIFNDLFS
jgi:hypothetical protein